MPDFTPIHPAFQAPRKGILKPAAALFAFVCPPPPTRESRFKRKYRRFKGDTFFACYTGLLQYVLFSKTLSSLGENNSAPTFMVYGLWFLHTTESINGGAAAYLPLVKDINAVSERYKNLLARKHTKGLNQDLQD